MSFVKKYKDGLLIKIHVQPKAKKDEIVGIQGDTLKVRIKAPPIKGKANEALQKFLSKLLKISKSSIEIVSGETSKQKSIYIKGRTLEDIEKCLGAK